MLEEGAEDHGLSGDGQLEVSSVLWEKSFQQSIFVDIGDDESLHFSDIQDSFAVCLSEDSAPGSGIHLSEQTDFYKDFQYEESESKSSFRDGKEHDMERGSRSNRTKVSLQRPNTMEELSVQRYEEPGDTSDEDQEDLPYDDDGVVSEANHNTEQRTDEFIMAASVLSSGFVGTSVLSAAGIEDKKTQRCHTRGVLINDPKAGGLGEAGPREAGSMMGGPFRGEPHSNITEVLLRHLSQEELFTASKYIDAETMPEVSFDDSVEETLLSKAFRLVSHGISSYSDEQTLSTHNSRESEQTLSTHNSRELAQTLSTHNSRDVEPTLSTHNSRDVEQTLSTHNNRESEQTLSTHNSRESEQTLSTHNSRELEQTLSTHNSRDVEQTLSTHNSRDVEPTLSTHNSRDVEQTLGGTGAMASVSCSQVGLHEGPEQCSRPSSPEPTNDHFQVQKFLLRSCNDLKYGQGQVHYPLPDFSKVAPKVKIPKGNNTTRPVDKLPSLLRVQSSPSMLGKSSKTTADVVSKVLDSFRTPKKNPRVFSIQQHENSAKTPELVQHLQAEYDKLLTRYAEAENVIDQMRLGAKAKDPTEPPIELQASPEMQTPGFTSPPEMQTAAFTSPLETPENELDQRNSWRLAHHHYTGYPEDLIDPRKPNPDPTEAIQQASEGEKMTAELRGIIGEFMHKVDEFKNSLNTTSAGITEQQMVFRTMMEAQEQLERNYIARKAEHRALEMQNYMGLAKNTGEFDPERRVEGEIFRIGMLLEDIKEQIDRRIRNQLSSPASSIPEVHTLSFLPSRPQDPALGLSTRDPSACVGCGADGNPENGLLPQADPMPQSTGLADHSLRYSGGSLERLELAASEEDEDEEEEEEDLSGGVHNDDSSATVSRYRQCEAKSLQTSMRWEPALCMDSAGNDSVSSATNTPGFTVQTQSTLQGTVSPETDSGFGSSDQSHPATEQLQAGLDQRSAWADMSRSDSEASCSNTQTAVSQAAPSRHAAPSSNSWTDQWVHSVAGEGSAALAELTDGDSHTSSCPRRQEKATSSLARILLAGGTQESAAGAEAHSHTCTCHSSKEILALQSEVSRLRRDVEESLLCLPYITKRLDYLASEYHQDQRQKSRPLSRQKSRPPSKPDPCSEWSPAGSRQGTPINTNSSPVVRSGDWVTVDAEPSTSKEIRDDSELKHPLDSAKSTHQPWFTVNLRSTHSLLPCSSSTLPIQGRSTQSDSALLPGGYAYCRNQPPNHIASRTGSHRKYRGRQVRANKPCTSANERSAAVWPACDQGEDISRTLDKAIKAALGMKRTTDRMAKNLSADLAKAELYRKLHGLYMPDIQPDSDG